MSNLKTTDGVKCYPTFWIYQKYYLQQFRIKKMAVKLDLLLSKTIYCDQNCPPASLVLGGQFQSTTYNIIIEKKKIKLVYLETINIFLSIEKLVLNFQHFISSKVLSKLIQCLKFCQLIFIRFTKSSQMKFGQHIFITTITSINCVLGLLNRRLKDIDWPQLMYILIINVIFLKRDILIAHH